MLAVPRNLLDEQNWSLDTRRSKVRSRDGEKLHDGDGPAAIEDVLDSSLVQVGNFVETITSYKYRAPCHDIVA
mgnify:CR=1 FL=1|tara:strand:- start:205 stop:423 length:219 start_codon:yes stop_codon:yes gene_type:complete